MAISEFSLRLQHGIAGGFAPPTPEAIFSINKGSSDPSLFISAAIRPLGTPELQSIAPKTVGYGDSTHLVDELHSILKSIPTESPPGSQDIYGLDTSIAWMSDDLTWYNGGPEGCGGGVSTVQPTLEQKEKFKRAVEIVKSIVGDVE